MIRLNCKLRKLNKRSQQLLAVALATLPMSIGYAQDEAIEEADVYELSPFVVSTTDDMGYYATSTLAGSRLKTSLKDVASSVAILTPTLLDDIGGNDIETAFAYVAGVETALSTSTAERSNDGSIGESTVNTQPGGNRVRGLARADVTRNFFQSGNGNLDRYNVERIELIRGPNSILFGLGSPAGIVNVTTKKASLAKEITEVSFMVDTFGTLRSTFDVNRVLIDDKLAVRVMGLTENIKSQFDTSFDEDQRLSASVVYKPFKKTTIRVNAEGTDNDARRPNYQVPVDNISHWVNSGRPIWDIREPNNVGVFPAANFLGGPNPNPTPGGPAILNGGVEEFNSPFPFTNVQFFLPGSSEPFITTKAAVGFQTINDEGNFTEVNQVEDDTRRVLARSRSAYDMVDNFINTTFDSDKYFPIYDINLAALPGNKQRRAGEVLEFSLEQQFFDKLFVDLSAHRNTTRDKNTSRFTGADRAVSIDLNPVLLDGTTTNPGYLRPFISGRGGYSENTVTNEVLRATVAYEFDFDNINEKIGFLGRHVFSGAAHNSKQTNIRSSGSPSSIHSNDTQAFGVNKTIYGSWIFQNWYLGDPFTADQQAPNYTAYTTREIDVRTPVSVYRPENGATNADPLVWSNTDPAGTGINWANATWSEREVEGAGFTWQGFFWGDKIVTTFGVREDTVKSDSANQVQDEITSLVDPANPEVWGPSAPEDLAPSQSGETSTKGIVFHPFDFFSVYYNESDNFDVGAARVYATGEDIPNSSGVGKDYGFVVRTNDNRFVGKLNYFETSQKNVSGRGSLASTARFGVNTYERFVWATLRNFARNRINEGTFENGGTYDHFGVQLDQAAFEQQFAYAWYDADAPDKIGPVTTARYFSPVNVDDTVDVDSKGYELEVIFNPTDNWRIAFNGTKVESIQDNIAPGFEEYVKARLPVWSRTWGQVTYSADGEPIAATGGIHFQDRPTVQKLMYQEYINRVVAARNTAKSGEGRINVGQATYSANLITNYAFREGRFKGASVGANVRWREGNAVGYPIIQTENGPASDLANPFKTDPTWNVSLNASYRKKIKDGKITWTSRLHLFNLVGDDKLMLSAMNPDGTPAAYRVGREPYLQWTNTFSF